MPAHGSPGAAAVLEQAGFTAGEEAHRRLFHLANGGMLMSELAVVLGVGVIALMGALYVFQKRELAY